MCVERTKWQVQLTFDSNVAYLEFLSYVYLPYFANTKPRYRSESIGNHEGRLFPISEEFKIGKRRSNETTPSQSVRKSEKMRRTKRRRKRRRRREERGKRVVKTSSVLRMGRKCLIAVRGSARWRNWFRDAYCKEKMNGPWI